MPAGAGLDPRRAACVCVATVRPPWGAQPLAAHAHTTARSVCDEQWQGGATALPVALSNTSVILFIVPTCNIDVRVRRTPAEIKHAGRR